MKRAFLLSFSTLFLFSSVSLAKTNGKKWTVFQSGWTPKLEKEFSKFVASLGESRCRSINSCLRGKGNPYRSHDQRGIKLIADCADLPYTLRGYFSWKKGLPFSYSKTMASNTRRSKDIRYSKKGNRVSRRSVIRRYTNHPISYLNRMAGNFVSTAMFRTGPKVDVRKTNKGHVGPDFYPIEINRKSLRPGTVLYDPSGHVAVVYKVSNDGQIFYMDAHPDQSITYGRFGQKFGNSRSSHGAGFKNFRPFRLRRGEIDQLANRKIADFSTEQYKSSNWKKKAWKHKNRRLNFYDYVRAKMSYGNYRVDPTAELKQMMNGVCNDFKERVASVNQALTRGLDKNTHPQRLPENIYGTHGEWEIYSTPSRDARLKASVIESYSSVVKFLQLSLKQDTTLKFRGTQLAKKLLQIYQQKAQSCTVSYTNSIGESIELNYDHLIDRLFRMSFNPYQCAELRWGAIPGSDEASSCQQSETKNRWYLALQGLRNQVERTYTAKMDYSLPELEQSLPSVAANVSHQVPAHNLRALLESQIDGEPLPPLPPEIEPPTTQPAPPKPAPKKKKKKVKKKMPAKTKKAKSKLKKRRRHAAYNQCMRKMRGRGLSVDGRISRCRHLRR